MTNMKNSAIPKRHSWMMHRRSMIHQANENHNSSSLSSPSSSPTTRPKVVHIFGGSVRLTLEEVHSILFDPHKQQQHSITCH